VYVYTIVCMRTPYIRNPVYILMCAVMCAVFSLIIVNKIDYIISINCKALWNCINKDVISMNVQNTL